MLFAFACSGGGNGGDRATTGESGNRSASAVSSADANASSVRSACELVTKAEIEALAGEPVEVRAGKGGRTYSSCEYWGTVQKVPYLSLKAYWTGGKEEWEVRRAATGMANDIMKASERVDLDSIVKPGAVPGLGDAAVYSELVPSVVLQGDTLLEMMVFYLPQSKKNFRPLAEKALSRL